MNITRYQGDLCFFIHVFLILQPILGEMIQKTHQAMNRQN